jgi:hypothetical protein
MGAAQNRTCAPIIAAIAFLAAGTICFSICLCSRPNLNRPACSIAN